ncbi:hypothetical protein CCR85_13820 [Rhodothalassium salexigens]|uniref:efflux RND transporter periplasmic adaptor subunit n=1 Tax=Rhodothalassium salexigens TaxID=1086 RepID=UPI001912941A|nr:efflux RND transporter periplasmic adaptor subunit [Rhodothalassium salexigens]MBK5912564.1 hypothetical protein [Rhodothalassium salexigens]
MRKSFISAAALALLIIAWMASGLLGGGAPPRDDTGSDDRPGAAEEDALFAVRARRFQAEPYASEIKVSGRAEALRVVDVAAEVEARVVETPKDRGQDVAEGDLLCRLDPGERRERLAEARALVDQRQLEYRANKELAAKGNRSETQLAAALTALKSAEAQARQWQLAVERLTITAPFAGTVEERPAELGDLLRVGDVCARVVLQSPFLVTGQVSEARVPHIHQGAAAEIRIESTGEALSGTVRYIAAIADRRTRTFRIEVAVPNEDRTLRDGMSATIRLPRDPSPAHRLPANAIVLASSGATGVRTVDETGQVHFRPVQVLANQNDMLWVDGLPETATVITVGQNFVSEGERVDVTMESAA